MDFNTLPDPFVKSGRAYLDALERLGLKPEGLLWAHDTTIDQFVLVLVTSQFDQVGPTEIFRVLTKAYNAAVTPREINPFIIRLHSVNQKIVPLLERAVRNELRLSASFVSSEGVAQDNFVHIHGVAADLRFKDEWVYHFETQRVKPADRARRWKLFAGNIEKLAA